MCSNRIPLLVTHPTRPRCSWLDLHDHVTFKTHTLLEWNLWTTTHRMTLRGSQRTASQYERAVKAAIIVHIYIYVLHYIAFLLQSDIGMIKFMTSHPYNSVLFCVIYHVFGMLLMRVRHESVSKSKTCCLHSRLHLILE